MSLQVRQSGEVPAETARVAGKAFPKGSLVIRIRDELGVLFRDEDFTALFPARGKPAWSPGRLAMVLVLQFVEGLSDRQAAEAVRARIDWKYALGLELGDAGFDYSVLSEFRDRLVAAGAGRAVFDAVLDAAAERGLLKASGKARTDSTHVLSSGRELCWLESVGGLKNDVRWDGYKVHLTETCEAEVPHLLTHVATTDATVPDAKMTAVIHTGLTERERLPAEHFLDSGYVDDTTLAAARRDLNVELVGPVQSNSSRQAVAHGGAYSLDKFAIDWDKQAVTCPNGAVSSG